MRLYGMARRRGAYYAGLLLVMAVFILTTWKTNQSAPYEDYQYRKRQVIDPMCLIPLFRILLLFVLPFCIKTDNYSTLVFIKKTLNYEIKWPDIFVSGIL